VLSRKKNFIFVNIPKVAGTSIARTLKVKFGNIKDDSEFVSLVNNLPFDPDDDKKFDPQGPHLRALDYVKYDYINQAEFDEYFKFAFVRNPWDRIVSEYKYRGHYNKYSLKEFLFHHMPRRCWSDEYCHIIPQYDFLYDSNGKLLVDFVGKFENLQEDYDKVCEKLNIEKHMVLHQNKSSGIRRNTNLLRVVKAMIRDMEGFLNGKRKANTFSHYTEYYDDESRDFVAKLYKNDIKYFNYEFGK